LFYFIYFIYDMTWHT